jgi:hypothetical protein
MRSTTRRRRSFNTILGLRMRLRRLYGKLLRRPIIRRPIIARRREPMGVVEDVRKALQDVVAPDLKALQVEVKEGFASVDKIAAIRHELVLAELRNAQVIAETRHEAILKALDIDKRLERVEARQAAQQATA